MNALYFLLAMLAGVLLPAQAGVNNELARHLRHPAWASLVSFSVGTLSVAIFAAAAGRPGPSLARAASAPWWAWVGGVIGAVFVTISLIAAPRIGAVGLLVASLAGQLAASVVLDHFGLLGYPVHALTPGRACGLLLVAAGAVLIRFF